MHSQPVYISILTWLTCQATQVGSDHRVILITAVNHECSSLTSSLFEESKLGYPKEKCEMLSEISQSCIIDN